MSDPHAEYLDGPASPAPSRRRTPLLVGGAVVLVALVGAGGWAAWSFFSTGPQPAEALPASTLAYASIDLDPSGSQKIEALRTLKKFPTFEDEVGLDTDDDVREWLAGELLGAGIRYDDEVEPWVGGRVGVAGVDTGHGLHPVVVLQVSDADAADDGLTQLRGCGDLAWSIDGDWALLAETQEVVDEVAADAREGTLAEDDDFRHWTAEAGGDGIATVYVSPDAPGTVLDPGSCEVPCTSYGIAGPELTEAFEDFGGLGATLRFDDGSLELETAARSGQASDWLAGSGSLTDVVTSLPDDTTAVAALRLPELDLLSDLLGLVGVQVPDDAGDREGDATVVVVGADGDVDLLGTDDVQDGGLGDTDRFRRAVPDLDDAGALLYVDFDAEGWFGGDEDLAVLDAAGATAWDDDGTSHLVLRVTTD